MIFIRAHPPPRGGGWQRTISLQLSDTRRVLEIVSWLKFPAAVFLAIGLLGLQPGKAATPSAEEIATGKKLCSMLDFSQPALKEVKALADAGNYPAALEAWRDLVVQRLRASQQGPFGWHSNQLGQHNLAEQLLGRMPQAVAASLPGTKFQDYYHISGPPGAGEKIDWLAKDPSGAYSDYSNLFFTIPLVAEYWKSGDPVYLQKWFEIASDFARNQKQAVEALPIDEQKKVSCNWSQSAQQTLSEGDRLFTIVRCLAVLAKSLPDGGKPDNWDAVPVPVTTPLPPKSADLFPPVALAEIAMSLVTDYPPSLMKRYLAVGAVPNQRRNGLASLLLLGSEFPEFLASKDINEKAGAAFQEYLDDAVRRDGGMLEQSFNYNLGDASEMESLAIQLQASMPGLAEKLKDKMIAFRRAMAALTTPAGGEPAVGNAAPEVLPAFWADPKFIAEWDKKLADTFLSINNPLSRNDSLVLQVHHATSGQAGATPAFTSVALPYSGYYAQRRDWSLDSPYLFFTASRPSRGHAYRGVNGIQLAANGRDLLVASGPPPYGVSFLKPEYQPDYAKIIEFLGETSSWKANTVVVDGKPQANNAPISTKAEPDPLSGRWSSSSAFDFVEGTYAQGYGSTEKGAAPVNMSVQHHREAIFVRALGIWIVTDRLTAAPGQSHTYTQLWNFPPHWEQGAKSVNGFTADQIVCDPKAANIHTADPFGPNLWLYHFGPSSMQYASFFGQKEPVYRGWFARGIGDIVPAPHVEASWKSDGDSTLVTVLWPAANGTEPPIAAASWHDLSTSTTTGFAVKLTDGGTLTYLTSPADAPLSAAAVQATANTLVTLSPTQGETTGLVLGAQKMTAGGGNVPLTGGDFEFTLAGSALKKTQAIEAPKSFRWVGTGDQIRPDYGNSPQL
jgi:hypothetical protein